MQSPSVLVGPTASASKCILYISDIPGKPIKLWSNTRRSISRRCSSVSSALRSVTLGPLFSGLDLATAALTIRPPKLEIGTGWLTGTYPSCVVAMSICIGSSLDVSALASPYRLVKMGSSRSCPLLLLTTCCVVSLSICCLAQGYVSGLITC